MPNGVTPEELGRRVDALESRTVREHQAMDERITGVATQSLTVSVWEQAERARGLELARLAHEQATEAQRLDREHARDIAAVREEIKVIRERPWLTTGRFVMIFLAVIALVTLMMSAWTTLKGAK